MCYTVNMKRQVLCTTLLVETSPQALPLGAACIASAIKKDNKNILVEVQDFSLEDPFLSSLIDEKKAEAIAKKLIEKTPSVICFSLYVWNRHILVEAAQLIKKEIPDALIIAGGAEVTASPESFINNSQNPFNFLVSGEGEKAVSRLIKNYFDSEKMPTSPIVYSEPCDLEEAASPYLDGTLDASDYSGVLWELARGCPYSCSYCYESKGEKKVRYVPKKRLYEELDFFVQKNVGQVFVLDPTYNSNKGRALELLRYIEQKAPGIFFHFECRPEFIDIKLARAFSQITCSLQIGLQSSNEKVLSLVNRSFNKKEFVRNIGLLNETGAVFGFDLIFGLPGDTYDGFAKSIDFALELYPNHLEIFQLAVLPGTDLFDRARELKLSFMKNAPYLIQETPLFPKKDIEKAKKLAQVTSLFYTQGRAVPWFLSLIKPLQKKPSQVLVDFMFFLDAKEIVNNHYSFDGIVVLQKEFIMNQYNKKNIKHLIRFAADLIDLNAAISSYIAEGEESSVNLNYHPDDLLSPYSQDPKYFVQHAEKFPCTVEISKEVEEKTGEIYTIVF